VEYPSNWHELMTWFPDDGACLRYLERLRWGDTFTCRFCGTMGQGWWQMADGLRRCAECRAETSVTAGTIFAGRRTPLVSWFGAVWYVVNQKQGVSALGLQRVLGLGSYQTAWAWLHKLRRAMVLSGRELLSGAVEVDECYIGARRQGSGGRGAVGKAIVVIAVEERGQAPGRVRMRRVPNVTKDTLTDFVLDHVARATARFAPTAGRATSTSASTATSTPSRTSQPAAIPPTWSYRTCTSSARWSSAGSSGPTRAPSATTSSATTSTSSRSASTAATHATGACSSTDSCRARWRPNPTPTAGSPEKPPHNQRQSRAGVAKWIASSVDSMRPVDAAALTESSGEHRPPRERWFAQFESFTDSVNTPGSRQSIAAVSRS
jgi:hypothetical protein